MGAVYNDSLGTTQNTFRIGATTGTRVLLKNSPVGALTIRNQGDTADAALTASAVNISGDVITLNSDAANTGADWAFTINRPSSGMTAARAWTLPSGAPANGNTISFDSAGVMSYVAGGSTASSEKVDTTALAFGTASPVSTGTSINAGDLIDQIRVFVDTPFNGTPTLSVGISGTTSKYAATSLIDLTTAGVYHISPGVVTPASTEAIILTYAAGGASAGAARVEIVSYTPS